MNKSLTCIIKSSVLLSDLYELYLITTVLVYKQAVLDSKIGQNVAGVVLTSPAVGVQPSHPIFAVQTYLSKPS